MEIVGIFTGVFLNFFEGINTQTEYKYSFNESSGAAANTYIALTNSDVRWVTCLKCFFDVSI